MAIGRFRALLLALAPMLSGGQTGKPFVPVLTISITAPVQRDAPVHITRFEHDERDLWFVLSNSSDKTVTSVILGNVSVVSSGCAGTDGPTRSSGTVRFLVRINPQGSGVASSPYVHYPKVLVYSAQDLRAASVQTQIGLVAVYFEDGTAWPSGLPSNIAADREPFDPKLVEAEAGRCPDVSAVVNMLSPIQKVVFDRESPAIPSDESVLPQLRFTCSLEGPKAICHMPREKDRQASGAHALIR